MGASFHADRAPAVTVWQVLIFLLSLYVLAVLFVELVFALPPEVAEVLRQVDQAVCVAFLADFAVQLVVAPRKWRYLLTWGWVDLLSSLPGLPGLRWGRLARVVRLFRILRGVRSARMALAILWRNKARSVFACVCLLCFILTVFGALLILPLEAQAPDATIRTGKAAVWWAYETLTAAGYGELYPVTDAGRAVAAVLMMAGLALMGTFTAYVASVFLESGERGEAAGQGEILAELKALRAKVEDLGKQNQA